MPLWQVDDVIAVVRFGGIGGQYHFVVWDPDGNLRGTLGPLSAQLTKLRFHWPYVYGITLINNTILRFDGESTVGEVVFAPVPLGNGRPRSVAVDDSIFVGVHWLDSGTYRFHQLDPNTLAEVDQFPYDYLDPLIGDGIGNPGTLEFSADNLYFMDVEDVIDWFQLSPWAINTYDTVIRSLVPALDINAAIIAAIPLVTQLDSLAIARDAPGGFFAALDGAWLPRGEALVRVDSNGLVLGSVTQLGAAENIAGTVRGMFSATNGSVYLIQGNGGASGVMHVSADGSTLLNQWDYAVLGPIANGYAICVAVPVRQTLVQATLIGAN